MASPRKFSEKIAQLAQRQAEGNAAFLQIMDDVKSAKVCSEFSITLSRELYSWRCWQAFLKASTFFFFIL
jgi:hypothetical protein